MIKKSYITTSHHRILYYEYESKENTDLIVFLNGLSDSISSWKSVKDYFQGRYSFLFVDLIGQGHAWQEEVKNNPNIDFKVSAEEQANGLREILDSLKIKKPFHLVGFSYGGGIAVRVASLFPERISKLILFLPYTIRLDLAFPIQRLWADQISFFKNLNVFGPHLSIIGNSYQRMIRDYMNFRFSKHIPNQEQRMVSMDLTEGIMPFNAFDVFDLLPKKSVHLVTVEHDTLVPKSLYREIWQRLPDSKKCSWLNIKDGEHLIFEHAPLYCTKWLETVLKMKPAEKPRLFEGNSYRMETKEIVGNGFSSTKGTG